MRSELVSNEDLARRVTARTGGRGVRVRIRCMRCRKYIPESRRADAKFCSQVCQRNHRWELLTALRTEMRAEVRRLLYPQACPSCGGKLNNEPGRHGPPARTCSQRCRNRENYRRRQLLKKQSEVA